MVCSICFSKTLFVGDRDFKLCFVLTFRHQVPPLALSTRPPVRIDRARSTVFRNFAFEIRHCNRSPAGLTL